MVKAKILCVDDIASNLDILIELLGAKYDLLAALDASKAFEILEKYDIDMILLDIMMPNIDGFTLASKIKSNDKMKDIPILFISAKSDEDSIEKCYELGAADYVSKPFKPRELLARVKTHLELNSFMKSLQVKVDEAISLQRYQEHLLIKQSYAASMGEMIDVIAHQWKQPLNVLNMRMSTLMLDFEDEMIDEKYIQNLQDKSLNQIRHLVNTLNDFRSFMSPHKRIETFKVQDMLKSCMTLIKDELEFHKIQIKLDLEHDFMIDAIENEFIHILLNILNNAKEMLVYEKIDKPKILVNIDDKNKTIQIRDNGNGIYEKDIESIFDLHFTRKKNNSGSGLGLYMSKMIIEKYGGSINAQNAEDGGAIFTLYF